MQDLHELDDWKPRQIIDEVPKIHTTAKFIFLELMWVESKKSIFMLLFNNIQYYCKPLCFWGAKCRIQRHIIIKSVFIPHCLKKKKKKTQSKIFESTQRWVFKSLEILKSKHETRNRGTTQPLKKEMTGMFIQTHTDRGLNAESRRDWTQ